MKIKYFLAISIIFVSIAACVIPGASQPLQIDQNSLSTAIVQTVSAATTQTAAAPIGQSPTPTLPPVNETSIEELPDGSVKFTHISGGYEVTFPKGWLTVRPNSEEFNDAYSRDVAKNSLLAGQMDYDVSTYEAGFTQLHSYALRPDIEKNFLFGFSTVRWDSRDTLSLNQSSMGELARELETSGVIPGFRVDTAQIYETVNTVEVIEIGGQFSLSDGQDGVIPFYMTAFFFKPTAETLTRITITYLKDYTTQLSADVNSVIISVKLLGQ
jgi:hypothetical protein